MIGWTIVGLKIEIFSVKTANIHNLLQARIQYQNNFFTMEYTFWILLLPHVSCMPKRPAIAC